MVQNKNTAQLMTHKIDLWKVECLRSHVWRQPLTFGIKTS